MAAGNKLSKRNWENPTSLARSRRYTTRLEYLRQRGALVHIRRITSTYGLRRGHHDSALGLCSGNHTNPRVVSAKLSLPACWTFAYIDTWSWSCMPPSSIDPTCVLSPLGVVPQRDRRPRLNVNYTFLDINAETAPLAPRKAMRFGRALQRVISHIVHSDPPTGPSTRQKSTLLMASVKSGYRR